MSVRILLLALGVLLIVIPILLRLLNVLPYILIGCFFPLMGCLVITKYYIFKPYSLDEIQNERNHYFKFYKGVSWRKNIEKMKNVELLKDEDHQLYPENFLINDTINNLIGLIIQNFVATWSKRISTSDSFNTSLHRVFSFSARSLIERLNGINYADVLVINLIPIFNEHIKNFLSANDITKKKRMLNKSNKRKTDLSEETVLAFNYNKGKLHSSLKLNSQTAEENVKDYLSSLVDKILPHLLEPKEIDSRSSFILVRELLACCVLNPLCQMLSNPDFFNQIIVENLSKQMKDRDNVRKIRNILRKHSRNVSGQPPLSVDVLSYNITLFSSLEEFLELASIVERSNDIENIQKFKWFCLIQKSKLLKGKTKFQIEESKDLVKYVKRVDALCYFIDRKAKGEILDLKSLQSVDSASYPHVEYPEIKLPDISFENIVLNASRLKYFSFFMQQRGERKSLLEFWIEAESLRNPLEYNSRNATLINLKIKEDEESSDEDITVFADKSLSQSQEIIILFQKFFNLPVMKIPPRIYYKVNEFVESDHNELLAYNRARRNMLKLQSYEYSRMLKTDYIAFQNSEIWMKMMVEELNNHTENITYIESKSEEHNSIETDKTFLGRESYGDPLAFYREKEDHDNYVDVNMTGRVSDKVVQAVEDALSQIMDDQSKLGITEINDQQEKRSSRLVSDDVMSDLFGVDNDGIFSDADDSFDVDAAEVANSTNDTSDHDSLIEEDMINSMDFLPTASIAPNVLDLSKEISVLEEETERLEEQKLIINTLLNKAEVINNIPECRILRKSLLSLEKELKLKNMQKEQLMVQEGENSLYQKSGVRIKNYITVKDKTGKTVVMYAIEVIRYSSTERLEVIASWIVTRRFSQFYELHHHLKDLYPEVRSVDFPKKTVMVKLMPRALIEERQQTLGNYLKKLITIKEVCADKHFRAFLSSEAFEASPNSNLSTDSLSNGNDVLSTQSLFPLMSLVDKETTEYSSTTSNNSKNKQEGNDIKMSETSFTKPLCDLVILLFQLSKSTNWLRGKGLIMLFQQIFGSTIEKTIRNIVDGKLRSEENVSLILMNFQSKLFPDGKFRQKSSPRTQFEKINTRNQAKALLALFLDDTTAKVFGRTAAKEAATITYAIFQNEILNKHLIMSLIDELIMCLFPELRTSMP